LINLQVRMKISHMSPLTLNQAI